MRARRKLIDELIKDGSDAVLDWPLPNALVNTASGLWPHADAGYDVALGCAREHGLHLPGILGNHLPRLRMAVTGSLPATPPTG